MNSFLNKLIFLCFFRNDAQPLEQNDRIVSSVAEAGAIKRCYEIAKMWLKRNISSLSQAWTDWMSIG